MEITRISSFGSDETKFRNKSRLKSEETFDATLMVGRSVRPSVISLTLFEKDVSLDLALHFEQKGPMHTELHGQT